MARIHVLLLALATLATSAAGQAASDSGWHFEADPEAAARGHSGFDLYQDTLPVDCRLSQDRPNRGACLALVQETLRDFYFDSRRRDWLTAHPSARDTLEQRILEGLSDHPAEAAAPSARAWPNPRRVARHMEQDLADPARGLSLLEIQALAPDQGRGEPEWFAHPLLVYQAVTGWAVGDGLRYPATAYRFFDPDQTPWSPDDIPWMTELNQLLLIETAAGPRFSFTEDYLSSYRTVGTRIQVTKGATLRNAAVPEVDDPFLAPTQVAWLPIDPPSIRPTPAPR